MGYIVGVWKTPKGNLQNLTGNQILNYPCSEKPLAPYFESGIIELISTALRGEIKEISDRYLTLEKEGKRFTVFIQEDAKIRKLIPPTELGEEAKVVDITFGELKVGDKITAAGILNADASLKINSITLLPPWY